MGVKKLIYKYSKLISSEVKALLTMNIIFILLSDRADITGNLDITHVSKSSQPVFA